MTTFIVSEEEAKNFAIAMVKNITEETFKQTPTDETIDQFGCKTKGKGYAFKANGIDYKAVIIRTERGWNVWIVVVADGFAMRL